MSAHGCARPDFSSEPIGAPLVEGLIPVRANDVAACCGHAVEAVHRLSAPRSVHVIDLAR